MSPRESALRDAEAYDLWFRGPWGRYAFTVESRALLRALGPVVGARVLDAGCGTGRFTAALELHGARTVGVDVDAARLALASRRLRGAVLVADATRLPFPDGSFDRTVAVTLLEFVPDPAAVMGELARVTGRGGRIAVAALNPRSPWGLAHRGRLRLPPWDTAVFLTRRQLQALGRPHGQTHLHAALFAAGPPPAPHWTGPLWERLGSCCPRFGAFQILTVDKAAP